MIFWDQEITSTIKTG